MKSGAKDAIVPIAIALALGGLLAFILYMAVTSPSCEDKGRKTVFLYFAPIVQIVGNIPVTTLMPVYGCQ